MTDSTVEVIIKPREKMVEDYRLTQQGCHLIFQRVSEVARFYKVSRKHLWQLSKRLESHDGDHCALLPRRR